MICIEVICDECLSVGARSYNYSKGVHKERRSLRLSGWATSIGSEYTGSAGKADYCPKCRLKILGTALKEIESNDE